jgi:histidyl-tRNA synthetase
MRAIAGGGRYDDLLKVLGGPKVGATGFGMGDPVLGILLEEKGKLPDLAAGLECFVVPAEENLTGKVLTIVGRLRRGGISADFSVNPNLAKSLKEANRRGARYALIAGGSRLGVKDLATGQQVETTAEQFLADPRKYVSPASDGHAHRP